MRVVRITTMRRSMDGIYASALVKSEHSNEYYQTRVFIRRVRMGSEWVIQINGYCTCPGFKYGYACKHIMWLANKVIKAIKLQSN